MTDYLGREHAIFFRSIEHGIATAISRENHFLSHSPSSEKLQKKWTNDIVPALRGSALVTMVANVEYLVGKRTDGSWDIPNTWYANKEFKNIRIIRHCWAHSAGRILENRRAELEKFLDDLKNGLYSGRDGEILRPHFNLSNDRVNLIGLERVRLICTELLAEKGMVEKWW